MINSGSGPYNETNQRLKCSFLEISKILEQEKADFATKLRQMKMDPDNS